MNIRHLPPLVSVIIPAYNAEAFIERTLISVLDQTYANLEVIVVDDGSRDRTAAIVKDFAARDERVILLQQKNAGVAAARNLAIAHAQGEFIAPIDADDIWYPENIAKQVQLLAKADSSVGLAYSWSIDINENNLPTGNFRASQIAGNVFKTLLCHNFIGNSSATLIRKNCFDKVGGYSTELKAKNAQGCEDWDLYLRLAELYQFCVVPEFLIGYRKIQGSMSGNYSGMAKSHSLMLEDFRIKHPEISGTLYRLSSSSFYMYLARQSSNVGKQGKTLYWLYKAIKVDSFTPIFRYGLYTMGIKSILKIASKKVREIWLSEKVYYSELPKQNKIKERRTKLTDLPKKQLSIQFKLLVGNSLHRLLLM
ncbi:MAG: glycosyltransferase family A protein, partial [Oscillatoria sp. PMC 1076.18]|nr:glycosyltransferase family A protein [Oscillatoria sp. PMC 1076.18]